MRHALLVDVGYQVCPDFSVEEMGKIIRGTPDPAGQLLYRKRRVGQCGGDQVATLRDLGVLGSSGCSRPVQQVAQHTEKGQQRSLQNGGASPTPGVIGRRRIVQVFGQPLTGPAGKPARYQRPGPARG